MKPIIKFYQAVLKYVQSDTEFNDAVPNILALALKASPSWEATSESVVLLAQCRNHESIMFPDDEEWSTILNDFVKAAFRDLSPLRDVVARELFGKVADGIGTTFSNGDDMLVWARTVKERSDGSGVLVIHVTDLKRFRDLIEDHYLADKISLEHSIEEGVLIGS